MQLTVCASDTGPSFHPPVGLRKMLRATVINVSNKVLCLCLKFSTNIHETIVG